MGISKRVRKSEGKKNVVFDAEVYSRGMRVAFKTCETRGQAEDWYEKTKSMFASGKAYQAAAADLLFSDVFKRYQEDRLPELRQATRQSQSTRFKYLSESPVMRIRMGEFSDRVIDEWFVWLRKHPTTQNSGRRSFRQELNLLRAVLHWYRDHLNASYVVPIVKRHRKAVHFKQVPARRADYYMRPEDIQRWIGWLKVNARNPAYWRLALFLTHTGARIGEATGLHWDAVDMDSQIASVIRTVWWDHHSKAPTLQSCAKNDESVRVIFLSQPVFDMLEGVKRETEGNGPIFADRQGGLLKYTAIQSRFNQAFVALGLPWRSTHICRHSFGTLALKATRDLSGVQASLGHRDIKQTQRYAKIVAVLDGNASRATAKLIGLEGVQGKITDEITDGSKKWALPWD